jgi:hypothetical protein
MDSNHTRREAQLRCLCRLRSPRRGGKVEEKLCVWLEFGGPGWLSAVSRRRPIFARWSGGIQRGRFFALWAAVIGCLWALCCKGGAASLETAPSSAGHFSTGVFREEKEYETQLTIRRPKPGSIWSGPKEAWCFFEQVADPEMTDPDDLDSEPVLPPVCLSPLLLFLKTLPTLGEVSSYFAEALGQAPVLDGEQKHRFERLLEFAWGRSWRRCILSQGARGAPGVTVDWWTNDDFGLSELREFFEAPFFRRYESVRFYQWMGEGGVHEADFRGHRLRMSVRRRDGVFFVRIQWWRNGLESDQVDGWGSPSAPELGSVALMRFRLALQRLRSPGFP